MKFSRRQWFASLAAAAGLPVVAPSIDLAADAIEADAPEWTPQEAAHKLCEYELQAVRFNHPKWWHRMRYESAFQYSEGVAVFYGIGPYRDWQAKRAKLIQSLTDQGTSVLGIADGPARRSWAVAIAANLSQGLQAELPRPFSHVFRKIRERSMADPRYSYENMTADDEGGKT